MSVLYFHKALLLLYFPVIALTMKYNLAPGIFKEELQPSPIFYQAFIPIIYQFQYPTTPAHIPKCTKGTPDCEVVRKMEKLNSKLGEMDVQSFAGNCSRLVGSPVDFCMKIRSHFQGLHVRRESLELYLERLGACPVKGIVNKRLAEGANYGDSLRFSNGESARVAPQMEPIDLQTSSMVAHWMEHLQWQMALSACAAKRLPISLVSAANLTATLDAVEESASAQGYHLSVPMTELGRYIKLPLTDCAFTDNNAFVVRMLVPVRRSNARPRFFKLHTIPFLLKDNSGSFSVCEMANLEGHRIEDSGAGFYSESTCAPDALCRMEEQTRLNQVSTCEAVLLRQPQHTSSESMRKYCRLECKKVKLNGTQQRLIRLPLVRHLASNRLVIIGPPESKVFLRCASKHDEVLYLPEIGALEITLSCTCSLVVGSEIHPAPHYPCGEETKITTRIPMHFFSDSFIQSGKQFEGNWTEDMKNQVLFSNTGRAASAHASSQNAGLEKETSSYCSLWLWIALATQALALAGAVYYLRKRIENVQWEYKTFSNQAVFTSQTTLDARRHAPTTEGRAENLSNFDDLKI